MYGIVSASMLKRKIIQFSVGWNTKSEYAVGRKIGKWHYPLIIMHPESYTLHARNVFPFVIWKKKPPKNAQENGRGNEKERTANEWTKMKRNEEKIELERQQTNNSVKL